MKSLRTSSIKNDKEQVNAAQIDSLNTQNVQFQDNRPEAINQRKIGEAIQNSPLTIAQAKLQNEAFGQPVQKMEEEELMQGKIVQKVEEEDMLQGKIVQKIEEEELMQGKIVQKFEEEDLMQGKMSAQLKQVPGTIQRVENKTGIPDEVKSKMESSFQTDFSDVKVHPSSAQAPQIGALAYTQGSDVHFAPGQFKPDTTSGQELLGHELTHVVQQREGIVKPTTQAMGMPVNDDAQLENEADVMGKKAAQAKVEKEE